MIAFDASAIISLVEGLEPARGEIVDALRETPTPWIVSTVALTEFLTRPKARQSTAIRGAFETFFSSAEIALVPVTAAIAIRAAEIRSNIGLKTPDAIHLATAIERFATMFVTTDNDFAKCDRRVGIELRIVARPPRAKDRLTP